jgi:hypothetical protein
MLAQVGATLDAADRIGNSNVPTILAFIVVVLAGALAVCVREIVRLQNARHADAEKHASDRLATSERHAAEMLALQGQMLPTIAEVHDMVTTLSDVAESLTDARDEYSRATPPSTPAPPPRAGRGGKS